MANNIIVNQVYLNNMKTFVDTINECFASSFNKEIEVADDILDTLPSFMVTLHDVISNLQYSNSSGTANIANPDDIENALKYLSTYINNAIENNEDITNDVEEFINDSDDSEPALVLKFLKSIQVMNFITENYNAFTSLVQGIYNFDIFKYPSKYREAITLFSSKIRMEALDDILKTDANALDHNFFDVPTYVSDIFNQELIELPESMTLENETNRITQFIDADDIEIQIAKPVQEAAEIDYFKDIKNEHFKYDNDKHRFKVSKQYASTVNKFMNELNKCDTSDDLLKFFSSSSMTSNKFLDTFSVNVMPFILGKVFSSTKKYPFDVSKNDNLTNYVKSYTSISDKNAGAKRFINYDLFTTFKVDKQGTLKFISDFLMLDLFNDDKIVITNNTLLTLFNIFDSRIYFDILFNNIPKQYKVNDFATENSFVKTIRGRINANTRAANVYKSDASDKIKTADDTDSIAEYCTTALNEFGDMSITDMVCCEQYHQVLYKEAEIANSKMYNQKIKSYSIDRFMESAVNNVNGIIFQEVENGDIPDYIKTRINLSDGNNKKNTTSDDNDNDNEDIPDDAPQNPLEDILNSVDEKMDGKSDNMSDLMGAGYKGGAHGGIVYNITNNYSNSFNKTTNDSSSGKTVTTYKNRINTPPESDNNYNNSNKLTDSNDKDKSQLLSNGKSIGEAFSMIFESEEPLSDKLDAGDKPKDDLLTKAMDHDRKTLKKQQAAKKFVQKIVNTKNAITKPITRTRQWLTKIVDSLIKRDEDRVKAEIIESPSYRTALYKACRIALKLGLTGIAFTISGYVGAAYVVMQGSKIADKSRLKKEVQSEFGTELEILNDKIKRASQDDTEESRKAMWQMMRMRDKMKNIVIDKPIKTTIHNSESSW